MGFENSGGYIPAAPASSAELQKPFGACGEAVLGSIGLNTIQPGVVLGGVAEVVCPEFCDGCFVSFDARSTATDVSEVDPRLGQGLSLAKVTKNACEIARGSFEVGNCFGCDNNPT